MRIEDILNNANNLSAEELEALLQVVRQNGQLDDMAGPQYGQQVGYNEVLDPYSEGQEMSVMQGYGQPQFADGGFIPMFEKGNPDQYTETPMVTEESVVNSGMPAGYIAKNYGVDYGNRFAEQANRFGDNFKHAMVEARNTAIREENARNEAFLSKYFDQDPVAVKNSPFFERLPQEIRDRVEANIATRNAIKTSTVGNNGIVVAKPGGKSAKSSKPSSAKPTTSNKSTGATNTTNVSGASGSTTTTTPATTSTTSQSKPVYRKVGNQTLRIDADYKLGTGMGRRGLKTYTNNGVSFTIPVEYLDNGQVYYSKADYENAYNSAYRNRNNPDYKQKSDDDILREQVRKAIVKDKKNGEIYVNGKSYGVLGPNGWEKVYKQIGGTFHVPDNKKQFVQGQVINLLRELNKGEKILHHSEGGEIPSYANGNPTYRPYYAGHVNPINIQGLNAPKRRGIFGYDGLNFNTGLDGGVGSNPMTPKMNFTPTTPLKSGLGSEASDYIFNKTNALSSENLTGDEDGFYFNPVTNKYENIKSGSFYALDGDREYRDEATGTTISRRWNRSQNGMNADYMNYDGDKFEYFKSDGQKYYDTDKTIGDRKLGRINASKDNPLYYMDENGVRREITESGLYDKDYFEAIQKGNIKYRNELNKQSEARDKFWSTLAGDTVYSTEDAAYKLGNFLAWDKKNLKPSMKVMNNGVEEGGSVSKFRRKAGGIGKIMGIAGALGKIGMETYRNAQQGYANAKAQQRDFDAYNDRQRFDLINQNNKSFAYGGIKLPYFEEGNPADMEFSEMLPQEERPPMPLEMEMTGEYMQQPVDQAQVQPNAEVEHGEFIKHPDGQVQQVEGRKHSEGGERVNLEPGTQVVSDKLKLGAKNAKVINDMFGLKVKAGDTYAKAIEDFGKKVGLKELNEQQEDYFKKLKKNPETKKDATSELNHSFLSEKINDIEAKKQTLESLRSNFTDFVFQLQQDSKTPTNRGEMQELENAESEELPVQDEVVEQPQPEEMSPEMTMSPEMMGEGQPLSEEELMMQQMSEGQPMMADGGYIPMFDNGGHKNVPTTEELLDFEYRNSRQLNDVKGTQGATGANYGGIDLGLTYDEYMRLIPRLAKSYFVKDDKGVRLADGRSWSDFQREYNEDLQKKANFLLSRGYSKDQVQAVVDRMQFINDPKSARHFDGKMGNYTSTRGTLKYDVLTPEEEKLLAENGIIGTYTFGQNRDLAKKLLGDDRFNIVNKDVDELGDLNIMFGRIKNDGHDHDHDHDHDHNPDPTDNIKPAEYIPAKRYERPILPDMSIAPPRPMEMHMKAQHRFNILEPIKVSPQEALTEMNRNGLAQMRFMAQGGLTGTQRAAYLTNYGANMADIAAKQVAEANKYNAQEQARVDQYNAQVWDKEELARVQDAMNFEKMQMTALNNARQDEDDYFEKLREINIKRHNYLHKDAMINSMIENYRVDSNGRLVFDPSTATRLTTGYAGGNSSWFSKLSPEEQNKLKAAQELEAAKKAAKNASKK